MILHQIVRLYHRINIRLSIVLKNGIITVKYLLKQWQKMNSVLYFIVKIRRLYLFLLYNSFLNFIKYFSSVTPQLWSVCKILQSHQVKTVFFVKNNDKFNCNTFSSQNNLIFR